MIGDDSLRDPALASVAVRFERHDELDKAIGAWTAEQDKFELTHRLQRAGVTAFASMTNQDIVEDAHLASRGFMVEWDQPAVGVRTYPGFPIHFSGMPTPAMHPCPDLGQDNHYVLREVLGDGPEVIADLEERGVIATSPPRL